MELISILFIMYAIKHMIEDTKNGYRKSKAAYIASADQRYPTAPKSKRVALAASHDIGYWTGQIARGFPVARHGLAAGWNAGRQAQEQSKAAREQGKQGPKLWRTVRGSVDDTGGTCLYCGVPDGKQCKPNCPYLNMNWREVDRIKRERAKREGSPAPAQGTRRVDGKPETDADKRFFDERGSGYKGPLDQDGRRPDPSDPWQAEALATLDALQDAADRHAHCNAPGCGCRCHATDAKPGPAAQAKPAGAETAAPVQSLSPRGVAMPTGTASDTTYDGVRHQMTNAQNNSEQIAQVMLDSAKQADSTSEQMQALGMDATTLGAMADYQDALRDSAPAIQRVAETAAAVNSALTRGHQGLAEAHQNAPVEAAEKPFYAA